MNKPHGEKTGEAKISNARELAVLALVRVYTQSAYARAALDSEIVQAMERSAGRLDPRDRLAHRARPDRKQF